MKVFFSTLKGWLKKPLNWRKRRLIWDEEMIGYLMEYFDLTRNETIQRLKCGRQKVIDFWREMQPESNEEIIQFYKTLPHNPFSLIYWHMTEQQRKFRNNVINQCFGKILDFGGGVGDLSVRLAERGLSVTYADVKGKNMEFAKWLFNKKKLHINVIDATKPLRQNYDTILCIDTIEHIPNARETLTQLCNHLRNHGKLIITNYQCKGNPENPLHIPITFDAEKLMISMGLKKTTNWLWIKEN